MRAACLFAMFALTLLLVPRSASAYSINFGQTVNVPLTTNSGLSPDRSGYYTFYADLYTFNGVAGQAITITMTSSAFSPYLYLRDPSGTVVASNYNSSGSPATISNYSLTSSGTYTIDATTSNYNTTGAYAINLNYYTASGTPIAPTNLTATAGNAVVNLSWSASSGANSYNVKRATVSGGPYSTISTGSAATNYPDTNVSNGTTYYYVVSGVNGYGEGANSSQASAKPLPPPPAAPTLSGTAGNAQNLLQWTSSGGAASYNLYRKFGNAGFSLLTTTDANHLSYSDTGLANGTAYTYEVSAFDSYGQNSASSNTITATPLAPVYQGSLEAANDNGITGWALDSTQPNSTVSVYIWSGSFSFSASANIYRADHGAHGFSIPMPTALQDGQPHIIHVWYPNNANLPNSPITYTYVPVDGATCSAPSGMPTTIRAGQTYPVSVAVQNTGNTKWLANGVYQLLSQNPNNNNWWGVQTVNVPADVAPGTSIVFSFNVTAPSLPGAYNFQWQMIHQGVGTFGSPTPNVVCANPADDAAFVSQTPPPTTLRVGQSYSVSVTMKNVGTNAWPANSSYQLLSQNPNNNAWWSVQTVMVPTSVAPGASVTFAFTAVAPSVPGAYNFQWCMVHQGVALFGDFTPNVPCANPPDAAAFVSQTPPPATIRAGQPYQVSVTMRNIGTNTWATDGSYALNSQNPANNNWWGVQLVNPPAPVAPGAQVTFTLNTIAPSTTLPGTYNFQWQMLHQGVSLFGDMTPNAVCMNPPDDAAFVSQTTPPSTVGPGQGYQVSVVMQNTGTATWPANSAYQLLSQNPNNNAWWHVQTVPLSAAVSPGGQATFSFTVTAPAPNGTYNYQWQMIHQGIGVFGDPTLNDVITVSQSPPVLEAASTDQALSATPSYFSGTGCNVFAAASPINGYITHAQIWINNILVGEYDDTNTTPFSTDPTLVRTYGSNQPRTNLNVLFDSTHFADTTALPIKLQVWDSTGQNGYVTIIAPVYNKAYVLENLTLPQPQTGTAISNAVTHTQAMNLYTISSAGDKNTIISALPTYTVFYAWTHAIHDNGNLAFGDGNAQVPPYPGYVNNYVYSFNVLSPNTSPKTSQPLYNFVFIDGCESGTTADLAVAFLQPPLGQALVDVTDRGYLGYYDTPVVDQHNVNWSNRVMQYLQQGMNLTQAVDTATGNNNWPHDYSRDAFGNLQEDEVRVANLADIYTKVHGVYHGTDANQWFKGL